MMKTIGMIGGMSWESSSVYYRLVNQEVKKRLGGFHSARCLMHSVDFHDVETLQRNNRWDEAGRMLADAAEKLEKGGADFIIICTNTMHKVAEAVRRSVQIPLLHIADATAENVKSIGLKKIALLGTRFTMEEDFYRGKLEKDHGLEVMIPKDAEMDLIHRVIFEELCMGIIRQPSKEGYLGIIARLAEAGAEGVILGCTEIGMLVKKSDSPIPLFDTTEIHAKAAVEYALSS